MSETPAESPAEAPAQQLRPSPPLLRAAGAIIDYMIVLMVVIPVLMLTTPSDADSVTTLGTVLSLVLIAGYPIVGIGWFGTTIGKWVTRLSVTRNGKRPPGLLPAALRYLVSAVPFLLSSTFDDGSKGGSTLAFMASVVLFGIVYLPILFDPERRGLHDRAARTRVVTPLRTLADRVERVRPTDG